MSWFLKRALIHLFSVKCIVWVSFSVFKEPYCILEIFSFSFAKSGHNKLHLKILVFLIWC